MKWRSWVKDPLLKTHGFTFDRTPAGKIVAPPGKIRVCAYHFDFDERPTVYADVDSADVAREICADLRKFCKHNVDYATAYDEEGQVIADGCPY